MPVRFAFDQHPDRNYYGIIDDDYWPITEGWYDKMIEIGGTSDMQIELQVCRDSRVEAQ